MAVPTSTNEVTTRRLSTVITGMWTKIKNLLAGYVPTSRTVNSKALTGNISLTASDVGAAPSGHTHNYAGSSSPGGAATYATKADCLEDYTDSTAMIHAEFKGATGTDATQFAGYYGGTNFYVITPVTIAKAKSLLGLGSAAYTASSAYAPSSTVSCTTANVKSALGTGSGTSKYLREDGTWQTPPDHTYTVNNAALKIQVNSGTATSKFTANASSDATITFATGGNNGTIKVDGTEVAVKGLGTAAYTASTAYAPSSTVSCTTANVKSALGTGSGTAKYLREDGTWQTPPNTWRGIQNNLNSDSTTDSLSAAQGKALANGSARDSTKSPTTHTHLVKINGSTKTIYAPGGTTIDLGTMFEQITKDNTSSAYNFNTMLSTGFRLLNVDGNNSTGAAQNGRQAFLVFDCQSSRCVQISLGYYFKARFNNASSWSPWRTIATLGGS